MAETLPGRPISTFPAIYINIMFQVLPGRTHPMMAMSGSGGFILQAIKMYVFLSYSTLSWTVNDCGTLDMMIPPPKPRWCSEDKKRGHDLKMRRGRRRVHLPPTPPRQPEVKKHPGRQTQRWVQARIICRVLIMYMELLFTNTLETVMANYVVTLHEE